MSRKPNTLLPNMATTSSPNKLNWENATHACLDRKNLTKPPQPAETMHDLQQWSEDEVSVNRRSQIAPKTPGTIKPTTQLTSGAQSNRVIDISKDNLNTRNKRIQAPIDRNIKKRLDQVARKTIRVATKMKDRKIFDQKHKTIDRKILTYTPLTAWVQSFGKQPRVLKIVLLQFFLIL